MQSSCTFKRLSLKKNATFLLTFNLGTVAEISSLRRQNTQTQGEHCRGLNKYLREKKQPLYEGIQEECNAGQVSAVQGQGPLIPKQEC